MSVSKLIVSATAVLALMLAGCGADQCLRHSDCPSQLVCSTAGQCEVPPKPDAAPVVDDSDPVQPLPDGALDGTELGDPIDAGADLVDAEDGI
jgi:hypothetical protein